MPEFGGSLVTSNTFPSRRNIRSISFLVNGAITINTLLNRKRGATSAVVGDELRYGPRAESGEVRRSHRGEELDHSQAITAVGGEGEEAGTDHAEFYVVEVVDRAVSVEDLIEARLLGAFDVDDG